MSAAWIVPSASKAIRTAACSWRDCPAASRFSRRSSTHFTGAPTFGAASIRHISSRCTMIFWPKPPPVSRITTRMRCSGMPEQTGAEQPHLVRRLRGRVDRELAGRPGVVDDEAAALHGHRRVRLLEDGLARHVGGGGEHVVERRRGQAADLADEVRAVALVDERVVVLGRDVVDDRRQRLVVDVDQLGRVLGEAEALGDDQGDRVADEAHLAVGQRRARRLRARPADRGVPLLLGVRVEVGGGEHRVHAGQRARRVVSMPRMRARAYGLRTKHACSIPGSAMSSTYVPRPVSSRASSTRARGRRRSGRRREPLRVTRAWRPSRHRRG